jgi:serine/threonine protein kinase
VLNLLPALTVDQPLTPGTVLANRYCIEAVAHHSSMSTVYRATDLRQPGQLVALKECSLQNLPPEERAEALAWQAREASLLSTLEDRHLPKFLGAFSEHDRHYVAMQFLAGETLEERIMRTGPQPEEDVLTWGLALADLLTYLHRRPEPIIYRDLKPANILIDQGALHLLDFGAARPLDRTQPGTAIGTPGYAPPEQYQGLADEQSDLYALGATLHRALTGYNPDEQAPFRHPPVRTLRPDVSRGFATIVDTLLQIAPQRRMSSAAVVAGYLGYRHGRRLASPLYVMYMQMIVAAVIALVAGLFIYFNVYGIPLYDPYPGDYKPYEPLADTLRVLLVFSPGLLTLLPLLRPTLRDMIREYRFAADHRNAALRTVSTCWLLPLLAWLLALHLHHWDGQIGVPGSRVVSDIITVGAASFGMMSLATDMRLIRRVQVPTITRQQLRRYLVRMGLIWAILVIACQWVPAPARAVVETAPDVQFGAITTLATDRQGHLFVLDSYGLRERMDDGRFKLLLNLREPCVPFFREGSLYQMTGLVVLNDGTIVLANAGAQELFTLPQPGDPTPLSPVAINASQPFVLAQGSGDAIYSVDSKQRQLILASYTDTGEPGDVYQPTHHSRDWQPVALTGDGHGNLYFVNVASSLPVVQKVKSDGSDQTIATLPRTFGHGGTISLTRDAAGILYAADGSSLLLIHADGQIIRAPTALPVSTAMGSGKDIFFATQGGNGLFVTSDGFASVHRIGRSLAISCPYTPPQYAGSRWVPPQ